MPSEDDEFENFENEINSQIGKITTNIGSGLGNLTNMRGSFSGRQKQQQLAIKENLQFEKIEE